MKIIQFRLDDILFMKKPHPCSKDAVQFKVLTLGSDIKIKCMKCGREVTVSRIKLEKNLKNILHADGTRE